MLLFVQVSPSLPKLCSPCPFSKKEAGIAVIRLLRSRDLPVGNHALLQQSSAPLHHYHPTRTRSQLLFGVEVIHCI